MRVTAAVLGVIVALGACGGAASSASASGTQTCIGGTYGLGLSVKAFRKENPSTIYGDKLPPQPFYGVPYYEIKTKSSAGCVLAYTLYMRAKPRMSASDLLGLFGPLYLPKDASQVQSNKTCTAWKSATFKKHFGKSYAEAYVVYPQNGSAPGSASMSLVSKPNC